MTDAKGERILLAYINSSPEMQSLLWDCGLMPEQVSRGTKDFDRMLIIADHWRARGIGWKAKKC